MITTTILLHIYGNRERAIHSAETLLQNELNELEVSFSVTEDENGWARLEISGEDEEFAMNMLLKKYGQPVKEAETGRSYQGYVESVEDDGIIVNIGTHVRIGPEELKSLGTGTVKQKASRFSIISHLPVSIKIIQNNSNTILASPTKKQEDVWWTWKKSISDRVIVNSVTRSQLKAAIKKTGHERDIYGIERIGLMEHAVVCRENTDGPGIVSEIGPLLDADIGVIIGSGTSR